MHYLSTKPEKPQCRCETALWESLMLRRCSSNLSCKSVIFHYCIGLRWTRCQLACDWLANVWKGLEEPRITIGISNSAVSQWQPFNQQRFSRFVDGCVPLFPHPLHSFTVSLHSPKGRHLPAVRAVHGDYQWLLKNIEIPTITRVRRRHDWSIPKQYSGQLIIKYWCQQIGDLASYLTDSPTAGSPGLCCSLPTILFPSPFVH